MTPLNERIEAYCKAHSLTFKPWEEKPWDVPDTGPSPYAPARCAGHETWGAAQHLRLKIVKALREEDAARICTTGTNQNTQVSATR